MINNEKVHKSNRQINRDANETYSAGGEEE